MVDRGGRLMAGGSGKLVLGSKRAQDQASCLMCG